MRRVLNLQSGAWKPDVGSLECRIQKNLVPSSQVVLKAQDRG